MNFNKNYPIAILDTNIVMDVPNILDILKGCNIVIPYTLIEELDNHKKENKGARDFVNNFLALSEKANLSKDGYKLENDCMLYLDIDKDNSHHKDINLDSKKQDIKFIAEAKNLKEKYNDMTVVLISSDKIMKITASNFEVEVKTLEEFIIQYINDKDRNAILDILYNIYEEYSKNRDKENSELMYEMIYQIEVKTNNIDGLLKLSQKSSYPNSKKIYEKIYEIAVKTNNIDGLFKLAEKSGYNNDEMYEKIYEIAEVNKDINGLSKLRDLYQENRDEWSRHAEKLEKEIEYRNHAVFNQLHQLGNRKEELEESYFSRREISYQKYLKERDKIDKERDNYHYDYSGSEQAVDYLKKANYYYGYVTKINDKIRELKNNK